MLALKKSFLVFIIILLGSSFGVFAPFGGWLSFDLFRFETYSSVIQLSSHVLPGYGHSSLIKKIKTPPAWMQDQIQEDLNHQTRITATDLHKLVHLIPAEERLSRHHLVTVVIDKQGVRTIPDTLPFFDGRRRSVIEALQILHKSGLLQPCQFLLSDADAIEIPQANVPIFSFSKDVTRPYQQNLVLLPDGMNLSRWASLRKTITYANNAYPWGEKKEMIFWRGSNTNPARLTLCDLSKTFPFLDAKITEGRNNVYEIPETQIIYKYLISLDGVTSTWPGLLWKLASNSLVIKQDSPHIQWYYRALKPYIHYLPIKNDLSNLEDIYNYAQHHDEEMRKIAETAHRFSENNLQYEDMLVYLKLLMDAYCEKIYRSSL